MSVDPPLRSHLHCNLHTPALNSSFNAVPYSLASPSSHRIQISYAAPIQISWIDGRVCTASLIVILSLRMIRITNYDGGSACCTRSSDRIVHFGHRAPSRPTLSGPGGRGSWTDL